MNSVKFVGFVLVWMMLVALMFLFPFVVIWALNTLFVLSIAYTFKTWLAVVVINISLSALVQAKVRIMGKQLW